MNVKEENIKPKSTTIEQHQNVLYELLMEFDRICRLHNIPYILYAGTAIGAVRHNGFIPWDDDADVLMLRPDYEHFLAVAEQTLSSNYFLQKEYSEHWPIGSTKLRKNNTTCLEKYHPDDIHRHQGIYIDIFPCDNASNVSLVRKIQFLASRVIIAKDLHKRKYETDSVVKKAFMLFCKIIPRAPLRKIVLLKGKSNTNYVHSFFGSTRSDKNSIFLREWITSTEDHQFMDSQFLISSYYDQLLTRMYGDYMTIPSEEERKCKVHAILVDTENDYSMYIHYRDGMKFDTYTRSIR